LIVLAILTSVCFHYQVIRRLRAKILAECNIVLGPEIHPLWQLPAELGAQCSTSCDHTTTHVVALDPATDKALWAKEHGVFLVHPRWVDAACYLWSRPPEKDFPVTDDLAGLSTATFAKSVPVEPGVVDGTNDKVEVAGRSPSDASVVPPVHVNGSAGGAGPNPGEKVVDNEV
jgi:RNA polymerase II C-terminal domain phosphatase-like 3/4